MRCHLCKQDSIELRDNKLVCNICNTVIEEDLFSCFVYNMEIEQSKKEGKLAYIQGKIKDTNPYSVSSPTLILHKSWLEGWEEEKSNYEREAFSSSAEKMKEMLDNSIEAIEEIKAKSVLTRENTDKYNAKVIDLIRGIRNKNYLFSRKYRRDLSILLELLEEAERVE